jgi:tripartite-type tricarboxylate transporter receptor subunit TctC
MMNEFRRTLVVRLARAAAFASLAIATASGALAADNEGTPIRIVVGYAPGGAADNLARIYAEQLRLDGLGTVIVENRPGASARLALDHVKRSQPDGKTIFIGPSPLFTIFPLTYKNPGYDADRDLIPAALLTDVPTSIAAGADRPYKNMKQYVEWARQNPEQASIGLATLGSAGHLGAVALSKDLGFEIVPAAYRGAAPMLVDVVNGSVSMGWDAVASMMQLYKSNRIQLLGVSGSRRAKALPEVPTLKEQGFDQFEYATSWYGAFLPGGTPPEVLARVERAFIAASRNPDSAAKLEALGLEVVGATGAEATQRMQREREAWRPLVEASGFVADE